MEPYLLVVSVIHGTDRQPPQFKRTPTEVASNTGRVRFMITSLEIIVPTSDLKRMLLYCH